jgi:sugar phosphate isomerase/epimerase
MRPISLAHLTVLDADPLTLIDAGAAGGFDALGLRIIPPMPTDKIVEVIGNAPLQRDIKARLKATGLYILDVEAIWLLPEMNLQKLLPALDVGAELGAKYMLVCGHDPDWNRMTANLVALCEAANARGLRIMLEPMSYTVVNSLQSANTLLAEASPENTGILVDALHLSRSGGSPADLAAYDPALFSYMHLCDATRNPPGPDGLRAEGRGGRFYPGEGELWLSEFLDAFPPDTPAGVEAPSGLYAHLPPIERGKKAGEATRALIRRHDAETT